MATNQRFLDNVPPLTEEAARNPKWWEDLPRRRSLRGDGLPASDPPAHLFQLPTASVDGGGAGSGEEGQLFGIASVTYVEEGAKDMHRRLSREQRERAALRQQQPV